MARNTIGVVMLGVGAAACVAGAAYWWFTPDRSWFYTDDGAKPSTVDGSAPRDVMWRPPESLGDGVNSPLNEAEPAVSPSGDSVYFSRVNDAGVADLFVAHRDGAGWTDAEPLLINSLDNEISPAVSPDGEWLYFASDRPGSIGGFDIWRAPIADGRVGDPDPLDSRVNSTRDDLSPALAPAGGGDMLYFTSDRPLGEPSDTRGAEAAEGIDERESARRSIPAEPESGFDLFVAGPNDRAQRLTALSGPGDDLAPAVTPSGDFVYFASDREGGAGGFDLYRARLTTEGPGEPVRLGAEINTASDELDPELAMEGFALFFASDRRGPTSTGKTDLYRAISREVYLGREARNGFADLIRLLPWVLAALAAVLLLALLARVVRDAAWQGRLVTLGLMAKCVLFSLVAHGALMAALAAMRVPPSESEGSGDPRVRVSLASRGIRSSITAQMEGSLPRVDIAPAPNPEINRDAQLVEPAEPRAEHIEPSRARSHRDNLAARHEPLPPRQTPGPESLASAVPESEVASQSTPAFNQPTVPRPTAVAEPGMAIDRQPAEASVPYETPRSIEHAPSESMRVDPARGEHSAAHDRLGSAPIPASSRHAATRSVSAPIATDIGPDINLDINPDVGPVIDSSATVPLSLPSEAASDESPASRHANREVSVEIISPSIGEALRAAPAAVIGPAGAALSIEIEPVEYDTITDLVSTQPGPESRAAFPGVASSQIESELPDAVEASAVSLSIPGARSGGNEPKHTAVGIEHKRAMDPSMELAIGSVAHINDPSPEVFDIAGERIIAGDTLRTSLSEIASDETFRGEMLPVDIPDLEPMGGDAFSKPAVGPSAHVTGRVVDAQTGDPVPFAVVRLDHAKEADVVVNATEDGRFSIEFGEIPDNAALAAAHPGYSPGAINIVRGEIERGEHVRIELSPLNPDIIAFEATPEVHHLGNDEYSGRINSQFQREAEGTRLEIPFRVPDARLDSGARTAELRLLTKGSQLENRVLINGRRIGVLSESPRDGSFGEQAVAVPVDLLLPGGNVLEIQSVKRRNTDIDDFEFVNPRLVLDPDRREPAVPALRIQGRAFDDATGEPLPGVTIRLDRIEREPIEASSNDAGAFAITVRQLPAHAAIVASKPGYEPLAIDVARDALQNQFLLRLRPASGFVIAVEPDPAVHHLGDDAFDGAVNSQFQRESEGLAVALPFNIDADALARIDRAQIRFMAKGLQTSPPVILNGGAVGRLEHSPRDGRFAEQVIEIPVGALQAGGNTLQFWSVRERADHDDYEFVGVRIVLIRDQQIVY